MGTLFVSRREAWVRKQREETLGPLSTCADVSTENQVFLFNFLLMLYR